MRWRDRLAPGVVLVLAGAAAVAWATADVAREQWLQRRLRRALDEGRPSVSIHGSARRPGPRVVLPRLGIDASSVRVPERADRDRVLADVPVAWRPRAGGPLVMAAHRDAHFRALGEARIGDRVRIAEGSGTRWLRVTSTSVVGPDDVAVLGGLGRDDVVLSTCYPFDHLGPAPLRWLVVARPSSVPGERTAGAT